MTSIIQPQSVHLRQSASIYSMNPSVRYTPITSPDLRDKKKFKLGGILKQLSRLSLCRSRSNDKQKLDFSSLNLGSVADNSEHADLMSGFPSEMSYYNEYIPTAYMPYGKKTYDQELSESSMPSSVSTNQTFGENDQSSVFSAESYISSDNDSILSENAMIFYNRYHSESDVSLTIMNPDEFQQNPNEGHQTYRDNIDDYDSDIESLHDDEPSKLSVETFEDGEPHGETFYIESAAHEELLRKQLQREFLRFEEAY